MLFAVMTLLCWTWAAYGSSRTARLIGPLAANRWRLGVAAPILLIMAVLAQQTVFMPGWVWFALAGVCHLGLGDIALYGAYFLLGPRLGLLVMVCTAPLFAGAIEWLWLGVAPEWQDAGLAAIILVAVIIALAPKERKQLPTGALWRGILCGLAGAFGQALGAVLTRKGFAVNEAALALEGDPAGAVATGFWRVACGALVLVSLWAVLPRTRPAINWRSCSGWLALAIIAGPLIGIPAYQLALEAIPAAVVQAVLAALPLTIIPLAWALEGDRPSPRSLFGGCLAVAALIALAF